MNFFPRPISTADMCDGNEQIAMETYTDWDADEFVLRSSARLAAAAKMKSNFEVLQAYYGEKGLEEEVFDVACPVNCGALVTRNHYGCLVLNATNAMFIDVDMCGQPAAAKDVDDGSGLTGLWLQTLDDLRTVLVSVHGVGFRIYRTAAGFRILATGREFQPGSPESNRLMKSVGADAHFVELCRTQQNFRARLTPKPWRCGVPAQPCSFPRSNENARQRFAVWLTQYEEASRDRATCRFLDEIETEPVSNRVSKIVEFHDRMTKAFDDQLLA
jgi:hypothetical protein